MNWNRGAGGRRLGALIGFTFMLLLAGCVTQEDASLGKGTGMGSAAAKFQTGDSTAEGKEGTAAFANASPRSPGATPPRSTVCSGQPAGAAGASRSKLAQGRFTYPNGDRYVGEFANGKFHGVGEYTDHTGAKYTGQWCSGLYCGRGRYLWPNGQRYDGEFLNGQMHGHGTMTGTNGTVQTGWWRNNLYVGPTPPDAPAPDVKPSAAFGTLTVNSDMDDCYVLVDGVFMGNTPSTMQLAVGPHTIEVKKTGYKDYQEEITIHGGTEQVLRPTLGIN